MHPAQSTTGPQNGPLTAVAAILASAPTLPASASLRARVEAHVEHLVAALDMLDLDPDLESSGDDEPYLAGCGWRTGGADV